MFSFQFLLLITTAVIVQAGPLCITGEVYSDTTCLLKTADVQERFSETGECKDKTIYGYQCTEDGKVMTKIQSFTDSTCTNQLGSATLENVTNKCLGRSNTKFLYCAVGECSSSKGEKRISSSSIMVLSLLTGSYSNTVIGFVLGLTMVNYLVVGSGWLIM